MITLLCEYAKIATVKHHLQNPYYHRPAVKQYAELSITKHFLPPKENGLNFEIPSCLYDSNNQHSAAQLQTKCQGVGGSLWVQFVKAAHW